MPANEDISNNQLAWRLERIEKTFAEDFAELKADLREQQVRYVSADRHALETRQLRDELAGVKSTIQWISRTVGAAVVTIVVATIVVFLKLKGAP